MTIQITKMCCSIFYRGKIYCCYTSWGSCVCRNSYTSWVYHKKNMFYIVIVKVQFILVRTHIFIQGQSILKSDIIGYEMH